MYPGIKSCKIVNFAVVKLNPFKKNLVSLRSAQFFFFSLGNFFSKTPLFCNTYGTGIAEKSVCLDGRVLPYKEGGRYMNPWMAGRPSVASFFKSWFLDQVPYGYKYRIQVPYGIHHSTQKNK